MLLMQWTRQQQQQQQQQQRFIKLVHHSKFE